VSEGKRVPASLSSQCILVPSPASPPLFGAGCLLEPPFGRKSLSWLNAGKLDLVSKAWLEGRTLSLVATSPEESNHRPKARESTNDLRISTAFPTGEQ
jgi:hypothetical protein